MDNPIEHLDLGLVNYTNHPSNVNYVVFRFADEKRANSFRLLLQEQKIWFEEAQEQKRSMVFHLFGLHKSDFNKGQKINITVESKHKKFIIPGKYFRWIVVIFGVTMIIFAFIGYYINGPKPKEAPKTTK